MDHQQQLSDERYCVSRQRNPDSQKGDAAKIILQLVAFAAGSLMGGGAFLHMIPTGLAAFGGKDTFYLWILTRIF